MATQTQDLEQCLGRGDTRRALALLDEATPAGRRTARHEELRISLMLDLGLHVQALGALRDACSRHPHSTRLWFARARLAETLQLTDEAHDAWRRIRRLRPRNATVHALMQAHFEARGETFLSPSR